MKARPKPADANTDPRWAAVTEALQRHAQRAAEQALTALTRAGDARSRDAARLTLAELWLQSGRTVQAKPVLQDLAAHGSTATVRTRAISLLGPTGH
jgi:thioredoxin-like negative regulator of GroEL